MASATKAIACILSQSDTAAATALLDPNLASSAWRYKERRALEQLRANAVIARAREMVHTGHSVVIVTPYISIAKYMTEQLALCVVILGEHTTAERRAAIDAFQSDQAQVLIISRVQGLCLPPRDKLSSRPRVALCTPALARYDVTCLSSKLGFGPVEVLYVANTRDSETALAYAQAGNESSHCH